MTAPRIVGLVIVGTLGWGVLAGLAYRSLRSVASPVHAAAPPEQPAISNPPPEAPTVPVSVPNDYAGKVTPFLAKYCLDCHNDKKATADLSLVKFKTGEDVRRFRKTWDSIRHNVQSAEMPPKNKPQPTAAEREAFVAWIDVQASAVDCTKKRDPGHPTLRRLNRAEYDNTIRDLLSVTFKPAADFPADDVGYGFDNIGDVLSLPPILFEKYLAAAEKILDEAIPIPKPIVVTKDTVRPQALISSLGKDSKVGGKIVLNRAGSVSVNYDVLFEGEYIVRVRANGEPAGADLPKLSLKINDKELKAFTIDAVPGKSKLYEARTPLSLGKPKIAAVYVNPFTDDKTKKTRIVNVELIEVEGPFNPVTKPLPESYQRVMIAQPHGPRDREQAARKIVEPFMKRAYRRPVTPGEVDRVIQLFKSFDGDAPPFEQSVKQTLQAVLVSPHFLFRVEKDREPENASAVHAVSDYELASRLSYFLWSSMPDDTLFALAEKGTLRQKPVLLAQVKRMLADPKAQALTTNFAGQWLQLRTLQTVQPDKEAFPNFDSALRSAIVRETELFFEHIVREDRSVLEFLDADYTYVNARLARHYGIEGVQGPDFRKVTLKDRARGGILTQASILTLTSNPTRTSPVKRGKWILENILGTPPPPPPPDAGELSEEKTAALTGSLRKRMEMHRDKPQCASCHNRMDPLGFGMENFDGIGAWRTVDGNFKIEPGGTLPGGESFAGPAELRKVLLGKADAFRHTLAEKLLTYALGRGTEYYDQCAVDTLVASTKAGGDKFSALVGAIVTSEPFLQRRGKKAGEP